MLRWQRLLPYAEAMDGTLMLWPFFPCLWPSCAPIASSQPTALEALSPCSNTPLLAQAIVPAFTPTCTLQFAPSSTISDQSSSKPCSSPAFTHLQTSTFSSAATSLHGCFYPLHCITTRYLLLHRPALALHLHGLAPSPPLGSPTTAADGRQLQRAHMPRQLAWFFPSPCIYMPHLLRPRSLHEFPAPWLFYVTALKPCCCYVRYTPHYTPALAINSHGRLV